MADRQYYLQAYSSASFLKATERGKLDIHQMKMLHSLNGMVFLGLFETAYINLISSNILSKTVYGVLKNEIRNIVNE